MSPNPRDIPQLCATKKAVTTTNIVEPSLLMVIAMGSTKLATLLSIPRLFLQAFRSNGKAVALETYILEVKNIPKCKERSSSLYVSC